NHIIRYRWDGTINNDFCIDLRRIPFSLDQQASRAVPVVVSHYSLIGSFVMLAILIVIPKLGTKCVSGESTLFPSGRRIFPCSFRWKGRLPNSHNQSLRSKQCTGWLLEHVFPKLKSALILCEFIFRVSGRLI